MATPTNVSELYTSIGMALPSVKDRTANATKAGISNFAGTSEQNQQYFSYYSKNPESLRISTPEIPQLTATSTPKPIALESLGVKQPAIPTQPVIPEIQSSQNFAQGLLDSVATQETALQKEASGLSSKIYNLIPELGGQTEALNKAQEAAGVSGIKTNLNTINNEINFKMAELSKDDVSLAKSLQDIEDKPVAMEFITGEQASVQRNAQIARAWKNAEINTLNARALAVRGDLELAIDTAQQAVESKYQPIKDTIDLYQKQLDSLKPRLDAEEIKIASEKQLKIDLALQDWKDKKDNEKEIQSLITKAAGQGADQSILKRASSAKTPQEAAIALGQWAGDYWQTKALEDAYKKQQVANTQTQVSSGNYVSAMEKYDATPAQLARAIAMKETNGGLNITAGASGELASKYQYMPATWASTSQAYNKAVNGKNAPLAFSLDLEDAVTEWQVAKWKAEGKSNAQIFAMWNGGPGAANNWQNRVGVNSKGVKYDVPSYVNGASQFLAQITGMTNAVGTSATNPNNTTAKSWLTQYNAGTMSLEDIYTKIGSSNDALPIKNELARLISEQGGKRIYGADDASVQAIQEQIKNINSLLQNNNYGSIVGRVQGGWGIVPDKLNTGKQDMLAVAKNLVSNQTLQALAEAKSKGITFGALSEGELSTLANSASSISSKIIKDKDGNVTGFTGSEDAFASDLRIIKEKMEKAIANKTNNSSIASGIVSTFESTLNNPTGSYIPKDAFVNSF